MRAELRDSLEFLYRDSQVGKRQRPPVTLDVARGGTISLHILLNGTVPGRTLRTLLRRRGRVLDQGTWFRLVDVPVEANTGLRGFIEKKGEPNPYVTRRAPFRVYDAMEPVGSAIKVSWETTALRFHLPIPKDARVGPREYALEVKSGHDLFAFPFTVNIFKSIIPATGRKSFPNTNWYSLSLMAQRHGLRLWSVPHWRMIRRYADLLVSARQNMFICSLGDIIRVRGKIPVLNHERLRRIVKTFTDAGMYYIEGGHFASRTGGKWPATTFDIHYPDVLATSSQGNAALAHTAGQLMDEIVRNGWRDRWVQHVADEPSEACAADFRILVGMVRKYMPGIPLLDAIQDTGLVGSVDIWCPLNREYQKHRKEFDAQRTVGDRVWFYTCCGPGGPWLNRLMDQELLRPALFGWGAALFNLDGFLHWGLNRYRQQQNPFEQNVVGHSHGNFLPAGDTHIVYPGKGRPWSSLRFEAQREGFEDYELLRVLQRRDPRTARSAIRKAIRGFDQYTKSVRTFRAARSAVLHALDS